MSRTTCAISSATFLHCSTFMLPSRPFLEWTDDEVRTKGAHHAANLMASAPINPSVPIKPSTTTEPVETERQAVPL